MKKHLSIALVFLFLFASVQQLIGQRLEAEKCKSIIFSALNSDEVIGQAYQDTNNKWKMNLYGEKSELIESHRDQWSIYGRDEAGEEIIVDLFRMRIQVAGKDEFIVQRASESKIEGKKVLPNNYSINNVAIEEVNSKHEGSLNGTWYLSNVSSMIMVDLPDYDKYKVIYKINLDDYKISVINQVDKNHEHDYSLKEGEYQIWSKACIVNIGHQLYLYDIRVGEGEYKDKEYLTLDTNIDPSVGGDGQIYYLMRNR